MRLQKAIMSSGRQGFISSIVGTIAILIIAVAVGGYVSWQSRIPQDDGTNYSYGKKTNPSPTPPLQGKACTLEAKQCPDGSSVSREGPTCEFAACPGEKSTPQSAVPLDWKTYRNKKYGFEVRYPKESMQTQSSGYTRIDLPFEHGTTLSEKNLLISIRSLEGSIAKECSHLLGANILKARNVIIGDALFREETGSEGAAGSIYDTIEYSITREEDICIVLTFTLQHSNPGAYATPPPLFNREAEVVAFDQILSTFKFTK